MTDSISVSDFGSSPGLRFENMGDKHVGRIMALNERVQTDPVTGAVKTFADGTPRPMVVISIQPADGEPGALFARGGRYQVEQGSGQSMWEAIKAAVRKSGKTTIEIGGEIAVAFTGLGKTSAGFNPPKLYTADYRPPAPKETTSIGVDDLFGDS